MSKNRSLLPKGEALRNAIRWLAAQSRHDAAAVEEAARRFDLSPLDEAFLLEHFVQRENPAPEEPKN